MHPTPTSCCSPSRDRSPSSFASNERVPLDAGSLVVVPRGRWHRHVDAEHLVELYHTPGQSLGCEDPATALPNDSR
jgi:hypothetical protein